MDIGKNKVTKEPTGEYTWAILDNPDNANIQIDKHLTMRAPNGQCLIWCEKILVIAFGPPRFFRGANLTTSSKSIEFSPVPLSDLPRIAK